jgi:hypothetical protein
VPRSRRNLLLALGAALSVAAGCSSGSEGAAGDGSDAPTPTSSSTDASPTATDPQPYAEVFQELTGEIDDAVDQALADAQPAQACVEVRERELAGWVARLSGTPRDTIDEVNRYLVRLQELLAACRDGAARLDPLRDELNAAATAVGNAAAD